MRRLITTTALSLALTTFGVAAPGFLPPPDPGSFLADGAQALSEVEVDLEKSLSTLHAESGVPVIVATISSLSGQLAEGKPLAGSWTVGRYAEALCLHWAQLAPRVSNVEGNPLASPVPAVPAGFGARGIVLLVSVEDRRLVLSGGYERGFGETSARLRRRLGELVDEMGIAAGLRSGMETVASYVKKGEVRLAGDMLYATIAVALLLLCLVTIIAYFREGSGSLPCRFWVGLFSGLGTLIAVFLRRGVQMTSGRGEEGERADKGRVVVGAWPDR